MKLDTQNPTGVQLKVQFERKLLVLTMLKPGIFLVMFSQVLLKKTCKPHEEKCDPLQKLRKQLKMPDQSEGMFRSEGDISGMTYCVSVYNADHCC